MQTTIKQITPVEYELEIDATAEELAPQLETRLREQRAGISLKGFRKGKVPISFIKKLYGEQLVLDVIEKSIMKKFQEEVVTSDEYEVVGLPSFGEFKYKLDSDLHAVLKFSVRPEIEVKDLSGETILKLVQEVGEEEIDAEIKKLRLQGADLQTREKGGIKAEDYVTIDMQQLDPESGTPILGAKEEGVSFFVDDEKLKDALRDALIGKKADADFRVELPVEEGEEEASSDLLVLPSGETTGTRTNPYQVFVKEVKKRELPDLDEDFIKEVTREEATDEAGLRAHIRSQLEKAQERESRELLESELMNRMMELHDFPVPHAATELFLDSFVEDLRRKYGKDIPENFDVNAFREASRPDAERQARWKLFRDTMVDDEKLEVTEEDRHAFFLDMSGGNEEATQSIEQYYKTLDGMIDRLDQQLLSRKVFDLLASRVKLEEKDKDAYLEALKVRQEKLEAESA